MIRLNLIHNSNNINKVDRIRQLKVHNKILGDLVTASKKQDYMTYETRLNNRFGKTLGYEIFSIDDCTSWANGYSIHVEEDYRNKGFNFGEILRLSSIITMVENKIKTFYIYSVKTAPFFHAKYKFFPDISSIGNAENILNTIITKCKDKNETLKNEAEELLENIISINNTKSIDIFCKDTNNILNEYMQIVLNDKNKYKSHPFPCGFNMKLTLDEILKNKDYFNSLFAKHNINYKI
ncbi:hypothetical protein J6R97_02255 [bacterium]|nr:hypothetical protein [bacterium]